MWFAPIVPLLALGAWSSPDSGVGPATSVPPAQPIATRQTVFAIPFNVPAVQPGLPQPVEVQLSVSRDGGQTWQPSGRARPDQRGFMFRAPGDGQYTFSIQTLLRNPDGSTQLQPAGPPTPGLAVIVDTQAPVLSLEAFRGNGGQITARWRIDERDIQPNGLSLQFRVAPGETWQPIAIPPQTERSPDGSLVGEVSWWPQATSGTVEIRAEVTDRAGNPAVTHTQVTLTCDPVASATPPSAPVGPVAGPSPGAMPGSPAVAPPAGLPAAGSPPAAAPAVGPPPASTTAGDPSAWHAGSPGPSAAEWPAYETQGHPLAGQPAPPQVPYGGPVPPAAANPAAASPSSPVGPAETPANVGAVAAGIGARPRTEQVPAPAQPSATAATAADRPRMVNSRLFELEYDVDSVGPSGIARVELWATRNGGRNWESFALDDDNRSPLLVKVDEEGLYGFKVVITSGAGLGGQAPQPGDLPDVTIQVDLTKPTAQILSTDQGIGAEAGSLVITWDAADAMLAPRPITLLYGEGSSGPWRPIVSDIENTGRYVWPLGGNLPSGAYFRLEVRDEAGNVGIYETRKSMALDRSQPAGRIRDIRPVGPTAEHGPRRYRFR